MWAMSRRREGYNCTKGFSMWSAGCAYCLNEKSLATPKAWVSSGDSLGRGACFWIHILSEGWRTTKCQHLCFVKLYLPFFLVFTLATCLNVDCCAPLVCHAPIGVSLERASRQRYDKNHNFDKRHSYVFRRPDRTNHISEKQHFKRMPEKRPFSICFMSRPDGQTYKKQWNENTAMKNQNLFFSFNPEYWIDKDKTGTENSNSVWRYYWTQKITNIAKMSAN